MEKKERVRELRHCIREFSKIVACRIILIGIPFALKPIMRYLPHMLLAAAALFAVIAISFGSREPAYTWTDNKTVYGPTSSTSQVVTHAIPNEISGRASFGFALASGMALIAAAIVSHPVGWLDPATRP